MAVMMELPDELDEVVLVAVVEGWRKRSEERDLSAR